jgi:hypothetical protein
MFAGLPGIGIGTLFYVLMALCMPFVELVRVAQGTSSFARWKRILRQLLHALGIVTSIMVAERVLLYLLGQAGPESLNPARLLHRELTNRAPQSVLAAPMTASLLILGGVLLIVELLRVINSVRVRRAREAVDEAPAFLEPALAPAGRKEEAIRRSSEEELVGRH